VTERGDSIRSRYAVTFATQCLQLAASFVTAGIVPRALGPTVYGNYSFLMNTAGTIRGVLDSSAQQAFFTFSSQSRESGRLTKLYAALLLVQCGLSLAFVGVSALAGITGWIWPAQALDQIVWATLLDWALFLAVSLRQLGDSKGLTIRAQVISLTASFLNVGSLTLLATVGDLNFYTLVLVNFTTAVTACAGLVHWLLVGNRELCWAGGLHGRVREYVERWWRFAAPLLVIEYCSPLVAYLSSYLVQAWYGADEQAYLAIASRWSTLVLVVTTSALPIVWREVAYALAQSDVERAARVYLRFNGLLFFLTVVLSFWFSRAGGPLVVLVAGDQYRAAVPVLAVMAFYPVAQTSGQLNIAVFKAAERTGHFRNISIVLSVPDVLLTYVLLAPPGGVVPGLGLGALGVALKLTGVGLVGVQVYERSNFRWLGLSYTRALVQKTVTVLAVGTLAAALLWGLEPVVEARLGVGELTSLALTSALYLVLAGAIVLAWPEMVALTRGEIAAASAAAGRRALSMVGR